MFHAASFNKILDTLASSITFKKAKKKVRNELYVEYVQKHGAERLNFLNALYSWATNKMHSTQTNDKIIALSAFTFYLDFVDLQSQSTRLANQIEKLLPEDDLQTIKGICYTLERISRRSETPILPNIFNRITSRTIQTPVTSTIYLFYKLIFTDNVLLEKFSNNILHIVISSLKHPSKKTRNYGIKIFMAYLDRDESQEESSVKMLDNCISLLDSMESPLGAIEMVATILDKVIISNEKISNVLTNLSRRIEKQINDDIVDSLFPIISLSQYRDQLGVFGVIFSDPSRLTEKLARLLALASKLYPSVFMQYIHANIKGCNDNRFFILAYPLVEHSDEYSELFLEKISALEITEEYLNVVYLYLKKYPSMTFKIFKSLKTFVQNNIEVDPVLCYKIIEMSADFLTVDVKYYHQYLLNFRNQTDHIKIKYINAFYKILHRLDEKYDTITKFMFEISNEGSSMVKIAAMESIPSDLYYLFDYKPLFSIVESFSDEKKVKVAKSAISLIGKVYARFPLICFNFFTAKLQKFISLFKNLPSLELKKRKMNLLPLLFESALNLLAIHIHSYTPFFVDYLEKPSDPKSDRYKSALDRSIRASILTCIQKLANIDEFEVPNRLALAITDQLFKSSHSSLHREVADTLLVLFRSKKHPDVDKVQIHKMIIKYLFSCNDVIVIEKFLRFFGTVGPLDPHLFHINEQPSSSKLVFRQLAIPAERQKCYLKFVMRYILDSFRNGDIDRNVLINSIVYNFQSDPNGCSSFVQEIVDLFAGFLRSSPVNSQDSIFHFLRSIILIGDISILPYTDTIMEMITPFIEAKNPLAVKSLSALVYTLKGSYEFDPSVYRTIISLLSQRLSPDVDLYCLLVAALMVIYCNGSPHLFFEEVSIRANENTTLALTFLGWVINSEKAPSLNVPALRLAVKCNDQSLINLVASKIPSIASRLKVNVTNNINDYTPRPDVTVVKNRPSSQKRDLANFLRAAPSPDNTQWLLLLTQELVLCSPSAAIRSCRPLLSPISRIEREVFPLALVSVWEYASDESKNEIRAYFRRVIDHPKTPISVLSAIIDGAEALDRAGFSLFDNKITGEVAERCGSMFAAVRFYENANDAASLLRVQAHLKKNDVAMGLLECLGGQKEGELFESLSMYNEAKECYTKYLDRDSAVEGLLRCCCISEDYTTINNWADRFDTLSTEVQNSTALWFFIATLHNNGDTNKFLKYIKKDDHEVCIWRSILALKNDDPSHGLYWCRRGFRSLALSFIPPISYEAALEYITTATLLEDTIDVCKVHGGADYKKVISRWTNNNILPRLGIRNLKICMDIRLKIKCDENIKRSMLLDFFNEMRHLQEWTHFDSHFSEFFDKTQDDRALLMNAVVRFDRSITSDINEICDVVKKLSVKGGDAYASAVCSMAARGPTTQFIMGCLEDAINRCPKHIRAIKKWAYSNLSLISSQKSNAEFYASNAVKGFCKLVEIAGPAMHYLCQTCFLFFKYGTRLANFEECASSFKELSDQALLQIVTQLVVQFDHPEKEVKNFVHELIQKLAVRNFMAIEFPLYLQQQTKPREFISKLFSEHQNESKDAIEFVRTMTSLAILRFEELLTILNKIASIADNRVIEDGANLIKEAYDIIENDRSQFHRDIFSQQCCRKFEERARFVLDNADREIARKDAVYFMNTVSFCIRSLREKLEQITSFDIDDLGIQIKTGKLNVAIPGFESNGHDAFPTVEKIYNVLKVIPSQKKPRKLRILGSNGQVYKYLLKGNEDLRLDQHIIQLFGLVNSILSSDRFAETNHLEIIQYHVLPLTQKCGLISWAAGGETLSAVIQNHRKIRGISDVPEKLIFDGTKDLHTKLNNLQKLEIFRDLVASMPGDSIRESMWMNSPDSQLWSTQVSNFAKCTALMSIVGYIIGLGDRHPLNILLMKRTGGVVHIDLSDCFEKAALRKIARETVPFRLTRMIRTAFGVGGLQGPFKITAINVLHLLRRNSQTLLAFLEIFVQEPVIDALWYSNYDIGNEEHTLKRAIYRVSEKLAGTDYNLKNCSVEKQVDMLISVATSDVYLSQMYMGWLSHW